MTQSFSSCRTPQFFTVSVLHVVLHQVDFLPAPSQHERNYEERITCYGTSRCVVVLVRQQRSTRPSPVERVRSPAGRRGRRGRTSRLLTQTARFPRPQMLQQVAHQRYRLTNKSVVSDGSHVDLPRSHDRNVRCASRPRLWTKTLYSRTECSNRKTFSVFSLLLKYNFLGSLRILMIIH